MTLRLYEAYVVDSCADLARTCCGGFCEDWEPVMCCASVLQDNQNVSKSYARRCSVVGRELLRQCLWAGTKLYILILNSSLKISS